METNYVVKQLQNTIIKKIGGIWAYIRRHELTAFELLIKEIQEAPKQHMLLSLLLAAHYN